ncbi:MAG: aspartyl/glutamyl-tRNA amidotransferase subunit C [Oscillospiraceae bacterium]|nr:aspartyl/glutamyl-tRNA amidotransferase subunit C [Oscillospiraceae bacterium]
MNLSTFELLCEASRLSFGDTERADFMQSLDAMVELASVVKQYDCVYDNTAGVPRTSLSNLREDTATPSYPPEKLLENAEALFDCYVIPKIME